MVFMFSKYLIWSRKSPKLHKVSLYSSPNRTTTYSMWLFTYEHMMEEVNTWFHLKHMHVFKLFFFTKLLVLHGVNVKMW